MKIDTDKNTNMPENLYPLPALNGAFPPGNDNDWNLSDTTNASSEEHLFTSSVALTKQTVSGPPFDVAISFLLLGLFDGPFITNAVTTVGNHLHDFVRSQRR
jgi:hypothetical protein